MKSGQSTNYILGKNSTSSYFIGHLFFWDDVVSFGSDITSYLQDINVILNPRTYFSYHQNNSGRKVSSMALSSREKLGKI